MATATNKNYLVIGGNGEELKTLKTLAAAKKLADAEGGSVLVDGECVYRASVETVTPAVEEAVEETVDTPVADQTTENVTEQTEEAPVEQPTEDVAEQTTEDVEEEQPEEPTEKDAPVQYRLKTLMNIRKEPSLSARKIGTANQGAIVTVKAVKKDWLHLTDGTFILFGGGEFAEKIV
ncbi:MAG: SH3 domain-containing protein [Oscillospiraceae bacterium]|nr:SH3 domain-containing protein [Oscillospiraceae bacterium]